MENPNESVTIVAVIRETRDNKVRYGIDYCIGKDRVPNAVLAKYNSAIDTICFNHFYRSRTNPKDYIKVAYSTGRNHVIFFNGSSLSIVNRAAKLVAALLRVDLKCDFMSTIPVV